MSRVGNPETKAAQRAAAAAQKAQDALHAQRSGQSSSPQALRITSRVLHEQFRDFGSTLQPTMGGWKKGVSTAQTGQMAGYLVDAAQAANEGKPPPAPPAFLVKALAGPVADDDTLKALGDVLGAAGLIGTGLAAGAIFGVVAGGVAGAAASPAAVNRAVIGAGNYGISAIDEAIIRETVGRAVAGELMAGGIAIGGLSGGLAALGATNQGGGGTVKAGDPSATIGQQDINAIAANANLLREILRDQPGLARGDLVKLVESRIVENTARNDNTPPPRQRNLQPTGRARFLLK